MGNEDLLLTEKLELNEKHGEDCVLRLYERWMDEESAPEVEYGTVLECLKAASELLELDEGQSYVLTTGVNRYVGGSYEALCFSVGVKPERVDGLLKAKYKGPTPDQESYFSYDTSYGDTETVSIRCGMYRYNGNLYIGFDYFDKETGEMDYYGDVTVNIVDLPYLCSTIDTNNNNEEKILEFLTKNGFGELTGQEVSSGFCTFPVFQFSEKMLEKACPEAFLEYQQMHGKEKLSPLAVQVHEAESIKKEKGSKKSEKQVNFGDMR